MNRDNAKDYLPLVQALAEGKVIQAKYQVGMDAFGWRDCEENISFHGLAENYRIKPEPREIWYNRYETGVESGPYESKEKAIEYAFHDYPIVQVCYREVIK